MASRQGGAGQIGGSTPGPGQGGYGVAAFSGDTGIPASYGTPGPSAGRWFAGGGGAFDYFKGTSTAGGDGGGGAGGQDGTVNTGGGGGATDATTIKGAGGSGILIVRYPSPGS